MLAIELVLVVKCFMTLQGVGLCNAGLNVDTATYIWSNTCKNALLYACESIFLSKQCKQDLDKLQARLVLHRKPRCCYRLLKYRTFLTLLTTIILFYCEISSVHHQLQGV